MAEQPDPGKPFIMSIAGSKGKTTVTRLLDHIYTHLGRTTLRVDTDGHYINGKQKSTYDDSMLVNSLVPTVCPGRYLRELRGKENALAILETAIGSANIYGGLGYRFHDIGIFTNVYEDHIGEGIPDRETLAELKAKYILRRVSPKGTAIFNADDDYVCRELHRVPETAALVPVGVDFKHFDIEKHRSKRGRAITVDGHTIYIIRGKRRYPVINIAKIPWTFNGQYMPSVYNLMFAAGAAFVENKHRLTADAIELIRNYTPIGEGGRLVLLENKRSGVRALVDYAHEKYSLKEVAQLANNLKKEGAKSIGIIRLAPDRANSLLEDTAKFLANQFDVTIVYDKVDGVERSRYTNARTGQVRRIGEVAKIIYKTMKTSSDKEHNVVQRTVENDALDHAFTKAENGDVVVHIVNDNKKSLAMVKEKMGRFFTRRIA